MAARQLTVIYLDGRVEKILATPRAQVMAEQYTSWSKNPVLATYYTGWAALNKAGKESADFETWLDLINDVEESDAPPADPTPPAPSVDTSSD
jgi:hypothetical protein